MKTLETTGKTKTEIFENKTSENGKTVNDFHAAISEKREKIHLRMRNMVQIAFEKAVAHYENPQMYPLPADSKSVERCFYDLMSTLSKSKKNKIADKINETLKASSAQRSNLYKDLANLNFKSSVSISEQVKALSLPDDLKISEQEAESLSGKHKLFNGSAVKDAKALQPHAQAVALKVSFVVDSLTCLNPDDLHKDEINLAGFAIDAFGNNVQVAPFFVGKFKKNETVSLGAKGKLFTLDLNTAQLVNTMTAGLFIVESDLVHNDETVNKLIALFVAIGIAIGVVMLALVAVTIFVAPVISVTFASFMVVLSTTFQMLGLQFIPFIGDDISLAATDTLVLDQKIFVGDAFNRTLQIGKGFDANSTFDGKYTATARWIGDV